MIFIFGSRLMGKVDQVPGFFHVATKFGHLNYLPLIPMQSYIVIAQEGKSFRGIPIPLSWKSVGIAWTRSICGLTAVIGLIATIVMVAGGRVDEWGVPAIATALGVVGFALTKWHRSVTHANMERACSLARLAGINERTISQIRNAYAQGFEVVQSGTPTEVPMANVATAAQIGVPDFSQPVTLVQQTFFVTGRNRTTGQDACITVFAADEAGARAGGEERDIDVRLVEPAGMVQKR